MRKLDKVELVFTIGFVIDFIAFIYKMIIEPIVILS